MRKQIIEYDSLVDALVAVSKRLSRYENRYGMESEEFFNCYDSGQMADDVDFIEWANDYRHYLAIRGEVEGHNHSKSQKRFEELETQANHIHQILFRK